VHMADLAFRLLQ